MDIMLFLNEVVFAFLEGFIFLYAFLSMSGKLDFLKLHPWKSLYCLSAYTAFSFWESIYAHLPMHTLFFIIFTVSLFGYVVKSNIYASAIAIIVIYILVAMVEVVVTLGMVSVLGISITEFINTEHLKFIGLLIAKPMQLLLFIGLSRQKFRKLLLKYKVFNKNNHSIAYIIFIMFAFTIIFMTIGETAVNWIELLMAGLIFAMAAFVGVMDIKDRLSIIDIEKRYLLQKEYVKSMELVIDAIRKEKHDYANHLNTLIAMCLQKSPDTLERVEFYARKLLDNNVSNTSYRYYNTGNKYLDGFLAVKTNKAMEKGIIFDVDFECSLSNMDIDDVDLTTVVGNIIDNAFDAVSSNPGDKEKIVSVYTYKYCENYFITVSNNGEMIPKENLKRIFEKKFSTKAKVVGERGFGLFISSEIVSKYGGNISVESTEEGTEFILEFKGKAIHSEAAPKLMEKVHAS